MAEKEQEKLSRYAESRTRLVLDSFNTSPEDRHHLYMGFLFQRGIFTR